MTEKELIVFDLDGTLTESKQNLAVAMAALLTRLLEKKPIAIIGGGKFERFRTQFLDKLNAPEQLLENLFLLPTDGAAFYRFNQSGWELVYQENLSAEEKREIIVAFEKTFQELDYSHPVEVYGELIEDRGAQITFSALGQEAPLELKGKWQKENYTLQLKLVETLRVNLPGFTVRAAGLTSIDVTRLGIDKAYGLRQMEKYLGIPLGDMLFVGDAIFPGGNDYAVVSTGVEYLTVSGPTETQTVIKKLLE